MRMKVMQFEPQGSKEGVEEKKYDEDQNSQWKEMIVLKEIWERNYYRSKCQTAGSMDFICPFYPWNISMDAD